MTNIDHGIVIRVGAKRRDGKYPVRFSYKSTGSSGTRILTEIQVREQYDRAAKEPELYTISGVRP